MSRAFFDETADALRGFLPRDLRAFRQSTGSRNLKVWFSGTHEHYEIQRLSAAVLRAGGVRGMPSALEIGFHSEHPRPEHNQDVLDVLDPKQWRRALGKDATPGPFVGRRDVADRWRRLSELWEGDLDDEGTAIEAAERLSLYIRTLEPLLRRADKPPCPCWSTASTATQD